jgi:hypothetical protein
MLTKQQQRSLNSELGLAIAKRDWSEDPLSEFTVRCPVCRAEYHPKNYTGRWREYCSNACKQKAYRQRKKDERKS